MSTIIAAFEIEEDMKNWLDWYSHYHNISSNETLANILSKGRQIVENEIPSFELRQTEKLLIQCTVESLLILKKTYLTNPEQDFEINQSAKNIIRKTLGYTDS